MSNENFKVPVIKSDTINELTTDTGTTVEGVLHKDGYESATVYRKTVVKYEVKFVIDGSAGHEAAGDKTACTLAAGHTVKDCTVVATNTTAAGINIRIAHKKTGVALGLQNYVVYDFELPAGVTVPFTIPTLAADDSIIVRAAAIGVNFYINGNDITAVLPDQTEFTDLTSTNATDVFTAATNCQVKEIKIVNRSANPVVCSVWRETAGTTPTDEDLIIKFEFPANLAVTSRDFDIQQVFVNAADRICVQAASANVINVIVYGE